MAAWWACCRPCCRCSSRARRTSASRPITSSSRFATSCGQATRPARASSRRCSRNFIRWKRRSRRWASSLADGRARGRRRARSAARIAAEDARGEGLHLDPRQGSRAVRARRPRGADAIAGRRRSSTRRACGRSSAWARADSRFSRAGRRRRGWLSGHRGIGASHGGAAAEPHGAIEIFHRRCSARGTALLFKNLATLRTDAPLFRDVDELRWRGPTREFADWTERMESPRLVERALKAQQALRTKQPLPASPRL